MFDVLDLSKLTRRIAFASHRKALSECWSWANRRVCCLFQGLLRFKLGALLILSSYIHMLHWFGCGGVGCIIFLWNRRIITPEIWESFQEVISLSAHHRRVLELHLRISSNGHPNSEDTGLGRSLRTPATASDRKNMGISADIHLTLR